MIPIRDHNPSGRTPFVSYFLIGINVLVFSLMFMLPKRVLEELIFTYALIPSLVTQGENLFTLISSMFLHGSLGHLLGNMIFLNIFGDNIEDRLGHFKFLLFYLFCGLSGSFLQSLTNPLSTVPNLGASGAIAGLLGSYLVLYPRHKIDVLIPYGFFTRVVALPAYTMLGYWILAQFIYGLGSLAVMEPDMGGVAFFAHIGGFGSGWLMTRIFVKKSLDREGAYQFKL